MKTLLLFLALVCGASAQTLKWTYVAPVGQFPQDHAHLTHLRGDAAGNCAVALDYSDGIGTPTGSQIIWLTATGKALHVDTLMGAALQNPRIVSVSPSALLVVLQAPTVAVLRKYTRRGAVVSFKDTPLAAGEYVALDGQETTVTDKAGFFVVVSHPTTSDFMHLKRFTVR